jgi:hypothetical protein
MAATLDSADLKSSVIIDSPSTASASIRDLEKSSDNTEPSTAPGSIQIASDNVETAASLYARSRSDYSQQIEKCASMTNLAAELISPSCHFSFLVYSSFSLTV